MSDSIKLFIYKEGHVIFFSVLIEHGYNKEDRGFSPHITLAREVKIQGYEKLMNELLIDKLAIKVKSISLMESTRIDNKLYYVPIGREEFLER